MNRKLRLYHIGRGMEAAGIGRKASNLRFLIRKGFAVPDSFVLPPKTCALLSRGTTGITESFTELLSRRLDDRYDYAVRSSAGIEDRPERSYAGQFLTLLSVRGIRAVTEAVVRVFRSARLVEDSEYHNRSSPGSAFPMAVIIQRMVPPVLSGIAFSRNPLTGLREIVVEAVTGSGERLAQDGVSPLRWRSKWGEYVEQPAQAYEWAEVIDRVVSGVKRIEAVFGRPADLEWVWDGRKLWWVQLREMTGLQQISVFSNRISKEMLPGLIKPLVWSVNIPVVNTAWIRLLNELTGPGDIRPEDLARSFHYRAYFNMSTLGRAFEKMGMPHESLELLLGIESTGPEKPSFSPSLKTMLLLPRITLWLLAKLRFAGQTSRFLEIMGLHFRSYLQMELDPLSEADLLAAVADLREKVTATAYFNVVVPLLMQLYNRLFTAWAARTGRAPEERELADRAAVHEDDPRFHLARLHSRYAYLAPELRTMIETAGWKALSFPQLADFRAEVEDFIVRFGHFSDNGNDFSSVPWREEPERVLIMIREHPGDHFGEPRSSRAGSQAPVKPRSPAGAYLLSRARTYQLLRERVSSLYTFGYGLFRRLYLELGRRFEARGLLETAEDVMYLSHTEVVSLVHNGAYDPMPKVRERRFEMTAAEGAKLPSLLFGDDSPPVYDEIGERLRGIPTSRGYYSGPVRVIRRTEESKRLQPGDVLVIPYSDVSWTPMFARAGAVISESGGILSHSSIIAREYAIPAVVSVAGALELQESTRVTVDGYTGDIIIEEAHT